MKKAKLDPNRAPTIDELDAASEYASSKLCIEIPSQITPGLTTWDNNTKKCKITRGGCDAGTGNPLSLYSFSANGTIYDWTKLDVSPALKKFWEVTPPEHLVWKLISTSKEPVCARANFKLQQFCEFPGQRTGTNEDVFVGNVGKGYTNVPPFRYTVRQGKETCIIGKDYCDAKGISYDANKEECYVSKAQEIGEFLLSSYLVREMNGAGYSGP